MTFDPVSASLREKLARWYGRRRGAKKAGLHRQHALMSALKLPRPQYPTVHITGTNGKTSTAQMTAALLRAHGWRTGLYTSPHLHRVNERVQVDAEPIDDADLSELIDVVEQAAQTAAAGCGEEPTFFELMTALALLHFAQVGVDAAVIEVGIGGDTDATNVIGAPVAIIGSVGHDHADQLGTRLQDIAARKAGIIAESATVLSGPQDDVVDTVIAAHARRMDARLHRYGHDFSARLVRSSGGGQEVDICSPAGGPMRAWLSLLGEHHRVNAALAVAAAEAVMSIDPGVAAAALSQWSAPGRGEVVSRRFGVDVWLDGAHNAAASQAMVKTLHTRYGQHRVVAIVGMMSDKDTVSVLTTLSMVADRFISVSLPQARAADADTLTTIIASAGGSHMSAADLREAFALADGVASDDDVIVVTGSLYLVAAARQWLAEDGGRER